VASDDLIMLFIVAEAYEIVSESNRGGAPIRDDGLRTLCKEALGRASAGDGAAFTQRYSGSDARINDIKEILTRIGEAVTGEEDPDKTYAAGIEAVNEYMKGRGFESSLAGFEEGDVNTVYLQDCMDLLEMTGQSGFWNGNGEDKIPRNSLKEILEAAADGSEGSAFLSALTEKCAAAGYRLYWAEDGAAPLRTIVRVEKDDRSCVFGTFAQAEGSPEADEKWQDELAGEIIRLFEESGRE